MSKIIQERRTCGSKAEVSVFDFSKLDQRAILFIWSGCSQYPGEPAAGFGVCERSPLEIVSETVSKEPWGTAGRTLFKTDSKTPKTYSQVWKGDNQSRRSCGKLQHCDHDHVTHDGRSCCKLQRPNAQGFCA